MQTYLKCLVSQPKNVNVEKEGLPLTVTRLLVRDAFLDVDLFNNTFKKDELDYEYTEEKWENSIDRRTGKAEHPRQLERVPERAQFKFQLIYNVFDDKTKQGEKKSELHLKNLWKAMKILEDDYLGGHGSRGYGPNPI